EAHGRQHGGRHLRPQPRADGLSGGARRDLDDGEAVADGLPVMTDSPSVAVAEAHQPEPRWIETRFGRFRVDERSVLHFAEGLPGFEQNRRFVLLSSDELAPMHLLHAVDGPDASFLAVDPR